MRFNSVPLITTNWISLARAAEITGKNCDEISSIIDAGQVRSNSIGTFTVVERGEILAYFENKPDALSATTQRVFFLPRRSLAKGH